MTFRSCLLGVALTAAVTIVLEPRALAQTTSSQSSGSSVPAPPPVAGGAVASDSELPAIAAVPTAASDSELPAIPIASPVPPLPAVQATSSAPLAIDLPRSPLETATASARQAPVGPGLHLRWPPVLPPLLSIEAGIGPRFGSGCTYFPAFPTTSVGGTSVPNLSSPALASENRSFNAFGGDARLDLNIPALAPGIGVNFEFVGGPSDSNPEVLDAGTATTLGVATSSATVPDVLPGRTLGIYARLLGLTVGYRNLAWAALPDAKLGSNPSANVLMLAYDISLPLGPVEGDANLAVGGGPVSGNASAYKSDIVSPQEGRLSLALKLYGIKVEAGVRAESLLFASDPGKLFSLFNLSALASNPSNEAPNQVASDAQSMARFSYTWGPFIQAGVAF